MGICSRLIGWVQKKLEKGDASIKDRKCVEVLICVSL
jgi:hypothetical protein